MTRLILQYPGTMDDTPTDESVRMLTPAGEREWSEVARHTHGLIVRSTALRGGIYDRKSGGDTLLWGHLGYCRDRGIKLYVNATSAGRSQCDGREVLLAKELEQFRRIEGMGFVIDGFQLQSVVSGTIHTDDCLDKYPKNGGMDRRIADVVRFCDTVLPDFPSARIILADTAAAKTDEEHNAEWDYQRDYDALVEGIALAGHRVPSFLLAWAREEAQPDMSDIAEAQEYFRARGWVWGLKPITDSANESARKFDRHLVKFLKELTVAGVSPDELVLTSWGRAYPTAMLPESVQGTLTHAGRGWVDLGILEPR